MGVAIKHRQISLKCLYQALSKLPRRKSAFWEFCLHRQWQTMGHQKMSTCIRTKSSQCLQTNHSSQWRQLPKMLSPRHQNRFEWSVCLKKWPPTNTKATWKSTVLNRSKWCTWIQAMGVPDVHHRYGQTILEVATPSSTITITQEMCLKLWSRQMVSKSFLSNKPTSKKADRASKRFQRLTIEADRDRQKASEINPYRVAKLIRDQGSCLRRISSHPDLILTRHYQREMSSS